MLKLQPSAAAVSYGDGHFDNIIYVPGSPEYVSLMRYYTASPERHDPPPIDTFTDKVHYVKEQLTRRFNLLLGRPANPAAATLAQMLESLHSKTKSRLLISKGTAGIASASGAYLGSDEINDALVHAGLRKLDPGLLYIHDSESNSAYAAHGLGLCASYTDVQKCDEEEDAFDPGDEVLQLDYTSQTISANTHNINTARENYATSNFIDWDLGQNRTSKREFHEADVARRIREVVVAANWPYTKIMLTGEHGDDSNFVRAVRGALKGTKSSSALLLQSSRVNSTFIVAQGAADLQWRRQRGWLECRQPKHCDQSRWSLAAWVERAREL